MVLRKQAALLVLFLSACSGSGDGGAPSPASSSPPPPPATTNASPVSDAGLDQIAIQGSTVTVFGGRSSDADGDALTFLWELESVPSNSAASLNGSEDTATFQADVIGEYTVSLRVNDGQTESEVSQVTIDVIADRDLLAEGTGNGMWPSYSGNLSSNKYSPLNQINAGNVANLRVIWRWSSPDNALSQFTSFAFEPTPLFVDGVLYTSTSFSQVAAIDAATGETLWVHDPQSYNSGRPPNNGFTHRGVSYDESTGEKIIHMLTGDARLIALNAVSGKPINAFGTIGDGTVNLLEGIPRLNASSVRLGSVHNLPGSPQENLDPNQVLQIGNTSPGTICNDVLVVGSSVHDGEVLPPAPPGDVRGFGLETGELLWTFHTVPREGEFGVDTWGDESWRINGNTNVWAPMSADEDLGMVYMPVSGATNNYYGGRRHGDNLFTNSILALDCQTGQRAWHYQTIHHDIWDYDLPAAPNLIDITVNGASIKALAQISKQGFIYVLDRENGEPVWPIPEMPVPASTVPGELAALTQPIPSRPAPFVRQGSVREDFINPSSIVNFDVGPLYTPPSINGLVVTPGEGGGANWGGASFDPETQILYATGFGPLTYILNLQSGGEPNFFYTFPSPIFGPTTGSPYPGNGSTITAYDMNTGNILWEAPGDTNAALMGNSATMISGDLLFYKNNQHQNLNVFNKMNGQLLSSIALGGRPTGVPMTYELNGNQFVVIAVERFNEDMELVALSLQQ